jgi:hypothetical protein
MSINQIRKRSGITGLGILWKRFASGEKTFFSEEKNQKTFVSSAASPGAQPKKGKVFCSFFSKKEFFL